MRFPIFNTAAVTVLLVGGTLHAQDLEPRLYSNSPIGLSFAIGNYTYAKGRIRTDPALPISNVVLEAHTGAFALATTLNVFGQSAKFDLLVPYTSLAAQGEVFGLPRERSVTGFGDPLFRFSINLYGAPALTMKEFANYKQDLIIGASLRVSAPLGQYDEERLVNIGNNRWSLRPEIGFSKAIGKLTAELASGVTFYTDNGDFLGGQTRKQAPIFATQVNLSYTIAPNCWLAADAAYFVGGRTTVDGVRNNDEREGVRLGATLAVPINQHFSIKIYAIRGYNAVRHPDLDVAGIALQYRWGGGL